MSGETFGQMLRRLREAKVVTVSRSNQSGRWNVTTTLSQNELAIRAVLNAAYVHRLEAGTSTAPSRATVVQLAEALNLSPLVADRLLVAAGFWPWDLTADELTSVIRHAHDVTDIWRRTI